MRKIILLLSLSLLLLQFACEHVQYRIRRGETPMRGVNLGGWLVVEHWMTGDSVIWGGVPDSVSSNGEFQTMKYLGHSKGDSLFEQHRSTWITEQDIIEIASYGINTVRVPVGYWIVGFDNHDPSGKEEWKVFAPGGLKYLDNVIQWGNNHNVAVLVGIHAAKGSQNGNDNSAPTDGGKTYWGSYSENIANTVDVAGFLAGRYKDQPSFLGIGMLNEPSGSTTNDNLIDYYGQAYSVIRSKSDCLVTHSPLLWEQGPGGNVWPGFFPPPNYSNCLHEWHKYLIWGYEGWSEDRLMNEGIDGISSQISQWQGNWLFIGEFSVATGGSAPFTDTQKFRNFVNKYFSAVKQAHLGFTYWTWKVSGDEKGGRSSWSLRNLIRNGDVPTSIFTN